MAGTDAVLELDKLSVGYDRAQVVRDLTLTVRSGEVVALLGANGAGKTTDAAGDLRPAQARRRRGEVRRHRPGGRHAGRAVPARHRARAVRPRPVLRADGGRALPA